MIKNPDKCFAESLNSDLTTDEILLNKEILFLNSVKNLNNEVQNRNNKITPEYKSGYLETLDEKYTPSPVIPVLQDINFIKKEIIPTETSQTNTTFSQKEKTPQTEISNEKNTIQQNEPEKIINISDLSKKFSKLEYNYQKIEPSLIMLSINKQTESDLYVIIWPDNNISVPVKTLAELLGIAVKVNHVDNSISFQKPDTKETVKIDVKNNKIYAGTNLIEPTNPKMVFVKQKSGIQDDIFVYKEIADYLLDCTSSFNITDYSLSLTTKNLKTEENQSEDSEEQTPAYQEEINEIDKPVKESKLFKLKEIKYHVGGSQNYTSQGETKSNTNNGNLNLSSSGNFLGGDYNIGSGAFYADKTMELGNFIATLNHTGSDFESSIGTESVKLSDLIVPSANILGASFGTLGAVNNTSSVPRFITGRAENNTYVELYINDVYIDKQTTNNGRFQFESINYPLMNSYVNIKVEQINQDNTRKIVYDRNFSNNDYFLAAGQKEFLTFSGLDSSTVTNSFTLFGKKKISTQDSLKLISGAKYAAAINKNITTGVSFASDYKFNENQNISGSITDYPVTYRNSRNSSGCAGSIFLKDMLKDNLKLYSEAALSNANSKSIFEPNSMDTGSFVALDYGNQKHNYSLLSKLYYYGPDFYTVSESTYIDKKGGELNFNWNLEKINVSGNLIHYLSNLDKVNNGGLSSINNMSFNISGPTATGQVLRAGVRSDSAKNNLYKNTQINTDFTLTQKLYQNSTFQVNFTHGIKNDDDITNSTNQKDLNHNLNMMLNLDLKKLGFLTVSNQTTKASAEETVLAASAKVTHQPTYKDLYFKLDRSAFPFKGITFSPNFTYSYGDGKGVNFGAEVGFKIKGLGRLMVRYLYNNNFSRFLNGNTYAPSSRAHTISFSLEQNIDLMNIRAPRSGNNTAFNPDNGIVKGAVFLDLNQNGIKDEAEKTIPNIDINVKNLYTTKTDHFGKYIATNLPEQKQIIGIDKETLPVNYTTTTNDAAINVKRNKVYVANFGVIVTPGNISGKINVAKKDESLSEIVVLLLDKNGKEIKYTTTDTNGNYYLDFVPPGEYAVVVDENYLQDKGLLMKQKEGQKITIPLILDNYVDLENIDIDLIDSLDSF